MSESASDHASLVRLAATAAFAIIGCTWAFAIARYGGPDEPAHVIRAAATAHGDLLGKPVAGLEQGYRQVSVPRPLASGDPACFRHDEFVTAACAVATSGEGDIAVATSAGTAPPWYYVVVGVVARIASGGSNALAYRMVAVLMCAVVLGQALARSRTYGGAVWLLAAFTPSAWFLTGVVGTSGIEIALIALALVESIRRFHHPVERTTLARVTVPLAVCLLLRPAALIDVAVVALVLAPTIRHRVGARDTGLSLAPLAIAAAATVAWSRWTNLVVADGRTRDDASLVSAIGRSLRGIPSTAHQAVGALGWNEFYAPPLAQATWIAALAIAIVLVWRRGPQRWWHGPWIVAALLLPTVVEVALHHRIGEIWQGRYSIPFAMAGVLSAGRVEPLPRRVLCGIVTAAAYAEVLTLYHTLRRYMVGLDGSITLHGAEWQPPLGAWMLLAVNGAAMAGLGVVALGSGHDVAEDVDDEVGEPGVVVDA